MDPPGNSKDPPKESPGGGKGTPRLDKDPKGPPRTPRDRFPTPSGRIWTLQGPSREAPVAKGVGG